MQHITKMEKELSELEEKYNNGLSFLEKENENPNKTDEFQRKQLKGQLNVMKEYIEILKYRISYDKQKNNI